MAFDSPYSDAQHEAAASARLDRGLPYERISELARAGQLKGVDGTPLEPFDVPANTVRSWASRERKNRAGKGETPAATMPHRDAVEEGRKRLHNLFYREVSKLESRKPGTVDPAKVSQWAKVLREIAALPDRTDPRPAAPGQKVNGERTGGETRSKLGSAIISEMKGSGKPPQTEGTDTSAEGEGDAGVAVRTPEQDNAQMDGEPGSLALALAAQSS
jgi:hypothetical protein